MAGIRHQAGSIMSDTFRHSPYSLCFVGRCVVRFYFGLFLFRGTTTRNDMSENRFRERPFLNSWSSPSPRHVRFLVHSPTTAFPPLLPIAICEANIWSLSCISGAYICALYLQGDNSRGRNVGKRVTEEVKVISIHEWCSKLWTLTKKTHLLDWWLNQSFCCTERWV